MESRCNLIKKKFVGLVHFNNFCFTKLRYIQLVFCNKVFKNFLSGKKMDSEDEEDDWGPEYDELVYLKQPIVFYLFILLSQ